MACYSFFATRPTSITRERVYVKMHELASEKELLFLDVGSKPDRE